MGCCLKKACCCWLGEHNKDHALGCLPSNHGHLRQRLSISPSDASALKARGRASPPAWRAARAPRRRRPLRALMQGRANERERQLQIVAQESLERHRLQAALAALHERAQHASSAGAALAIETTMVGIRRRMHERYTSACGVHAATRAHAACMRRFERCHSLLSSVPPAGCMRWVCAQQLNA